MVWLYLQGVIQVSIVKFKPDRREQVEVNLPVVAPKEYVNIARDEKEVPVTKILPYVSGSQWRVKEYYSQLTSKTNDLREVDPGEHPVYQQYTLIHNYELRVTSGLTSTYDQQTGISRVIGNSNMYSFIVPNINDYFVTDAGDSRIGLFKIVNLDRKTFNLESVYEVTYDLIGYVDSGNSKELYENLRTKYVKEYWFDSNRLMNGLYPLVLTEERQEIIDFNIVYRDLCKYYFDMFFNRRYMSLVLPGQDQAIYDPMLVNYITKIVEPELVPQLKELRNYTTELDMYLKQKQFWSVLLDRQYTSLKYSNKKMGLVNRSQFHSSSWLHGFRYSTLDYVVYPVYTDTSTLVKDVPYPRTVYELLNSVNGTTLPDGTDSIVIEGKDNTGTLRPLVYSTIADDHYVLSENFYSNLEDKSILEILTKNYIEHKSINRNMLRLLVDNYTEMNRLDQYYYGPIIITLVKEVVKNIHL